MDQILLPLVIEVPIGPASAFITATFAPNQANGCGATYDAVVYWPQACETVVTSQFGPRKVSFYALGKSKKFAYPPIELPIAPTPVAAPSVAK